MGKFNVGDSVWFPFDNGRKEQKGVIDNVIHYATFEDDYLVLGNVDEKLYTKHESELSMIAPHKRWLDPTEYTPNWEEQTKAIKKLEKELEDKLHDFKIGDEVLYYDGTHCNRNIRTGVITRIDYNPLYLYYEYRVRKLFTTISKLYTERDIICKTRDAEEYSKRLGINLEPFVRATNEYERHQAIVKDALEKWKPTISNIDYSSMYPGIPADCKMNVPLDRSDTYSYLSDYFNNSYSWQIAHPIMFSNMPDNNSVIKLDFNVDILKEDKPMNKKMTITTVTYKREIKDIIFSGPATVVKFNNQFNKEEKTVVKCQNGDEFDKTKGFLLALVKEFVDKKSWNNILRIIDSFEEEKEEKEKNIAEIFDSLPENVKNDIYVEIERVSRPQYKFSCQDHVKLKKSNTGYIVERCRWNEDKKCWEYFCNNGRGYCRWYEEDCLVLA